MKCGMRWRCVWKPTDLTTNHRLCICVADWILSRCVDSLRTFVGASRLPTKTTPMMLLCSRTTHTNGHRYSRTSMMPHTRWACTSFWTKTKLQNVDKGLQPSQLSCRATRSSQLTASLTWAVKYTYLAAHPLIYSDGLA